MLQRGVISYRCKMQQENFTPRCIMHQEDCCNKSLTWLPAASCSGEIWSFYVNFGAQRMNFNQWTVKLNQTEQNSRPLAIFCRFFYKKKIPRYLALKQWGP
jgi:hypothetical protein